MFEHLRGPWKRIIAPIARGLVRIGISANGVTIIGAVGTVVVAIATGLTGWLLPGAVVLAGVIIYLRRHEVLWAADPTHHGPDVWAQIGMAAALFAIMTSFVTSYARARAEAEGFEAKNGIATRSDRLVIILVGMALTGAGLPLAVLSCFLVVLALLGIVTVWQRISLVNRAMSKNPQPADPSHE